MKVLLENWKSYIKEQQQKPKQPQQQQQQRAPPKDITPNMDILGLWQEYRFESLEQDVANGSMQPPTQPITTTTTATGNPMVPNLSRAKSVGFVDSRVPGHGDMLPRFNSMNNRLAGLSMNVPWGAE